MGYVLFDLETELIQGSLDLSRYVPAITIGALLHSTGALRLCYEQDAAGQASGALLGRESAQALVRTLQEHARSGDAIVTWNGAGFDFPVLARASGMEAACAALAWDHVDMMFWLHCLKGFSVGLERAARAVGTGKLPGVSGADAPRLWAEGAYERVMAYLEQDVRALQAVYEEAMRARRLRWQTARGRISFAEGALCTVRQAYALPLPDTSWMQRAPWPREKFVGWMLRQSGAAGSA
ncbi:MAG: ribonuclease H-like domain-containing protein [Anaerolineae bacterium]|nr:ribonuclease H-like domain-containing protein [Anaerolineae bacterium]